MKKKIFKRNLIQKTVLKIFKKRDFKETFIKVNFILDAQFQFQTKSDISNAKCENHRLIEIWNYRTAFLLGN